MMISEGDEMNFNFTKEQELIQRSAREFAEKNIEPIAEQIDQTNEVPETVIRDCRAGHLRFVFSGRI